VDCVLITGAAGTIGRALRQGLHGRIGALRLLDVAPLGAPRPGEELLTVDIRDLEAVTAAMEGVDATVHLAGIPQEDSFDRILVLRGGQVGDGSGVAAGDAREDAWAGSAGAWS
jgi:uronate dehydrogenase